MFRTKTDVSDEINRLKAELVAKGCFQMAGVDLNEFFGIVSNHGLEELPNGRKNIFLNGVMEVEIYMDQRKSSYNRGKNTLYANI